MFGIIIRSFSYLLKTKKMKNKKTKWLWLGAGATLIIAIVAMASFGAFGENFQGMLRLSRFKITNPVVTTRPEANTAIKTLSPNKGCLDMRRHIMLLGTEGFSEWMTTYPNGYTLSDAKSCAAQFGNHWSHPTDAECNQIFFKRRATNTADFSDWMRNNFFNEEVSAYCIRLSKPQAWY